MQVYQQGAISTETTEEQGEVMQNDICIPHSSYEDELITHDSSCEEERLDTELDVAINEQIIKIAAEIGAKAAIEAINKERTKETQQRHDKRLRNTKLLLKNYRLFKKHSEKAVFEASQIEEKAIDILDLMWDPNNSHDAMIASIKKSAVRTKIIMEHIDEMLNIYETMCLGKEEQERKCRVLKSMYINEEKTTAEKIAEEECIDVRTVYKDIDSAVEKMTSLVFGVDWLA